MWGRSLSQGLALFSRPLAECGHGVCEPIVILGESKEESLQVRAREEARVERNAALLPDEPRGDDALTFQVIHETLNRNQRRIENTGQFSGVRFLKQCQRLEHLSAPDGSEEFLGGHGHDVRHDY